jgi:ribose transport system substrate-binding protein
MTAEFGGWAKTTDFSSILPTGDAVDFSKKLVEKSLHSTEGFTPPMQRQAGQKRGAHIAFVGSDLTNGGINTVSEGVNAAAKALGWTVGGFDPTEQASSIKQATDAGIPVIGWHAGNGMFTNVTTDPLKVSQLAAAYAIADSSGSAGVAIFTDGQYDIAILKAKATEAYVKACSGCSVLFYQDSPIAEANQRMPGLISNLLQQYGGQLGYLLAINGNYFGGAQESLRAAGIDSNGKPKSVAAGDGDAAVFQRIRNHDYRAATVAEPLLLQGWQLVDEANRAIAGQAASGFVAAPALITAENVPAGNVYDPSSGYQDIYQKVWGK